MTRTLTIGTRASKLALAQTQLVMQALLATQSDLVVRVEHITTKGDLVLDRPLATIGDKQLFIAEIEEALRAGRIDLAVHSAKDLAAEMPPDLALVAFPPRADPHDVVITRAGGALADLPANAVLGTGSARRRCQVRALRPDLRIADLRGNVDTRLRKLHDGHYDAILLAQAGLERLGLGEAITQTLTVQEMIPAVGQGVLALEARYDDTQVAQLVAPLDHQATRMAITAERAFLARIGGGCHAPVAAYARLEGATLTITGMVGAEDGPIVREALVASGEEAPALVGVRLAENLLAHGGAVLLGLERDDHDD
jgi:hydroxymethylbilane synthase